MFNEILSSPRERRAARELALSHVRLFGDEAETRLRGTLPHTSRISSARRVTTLAIRHVRKLQNDPDKLALMLPARALIQD